jgi:hypothetical protein
MTTEIEKARDGIYQRLLAQQGQMSRKVVKSIMEDIDALCKLHRDQPITHWSASTLGHHECSCGKEDK